MSASRTAHYAALMPSGKVLVVAGDSTNAACELFNPRRSGLGELGADWDDANAAQFVCGRTVFER